MSEKLLNTAVEMMINTNRKHRMLIDSCVKDIGIPHTQHRILMHLAKHGKLPSQKELAEHLKVTPAAVTGAIKSIEREGYVLRSLGHDNRFMEISITEKGRNLVKLTKDVFSQNDISLFEGFSEEDLNNYVKCLEKMQINIDRKLDVIHNSKGKDYK